jgi:hypothetical protein
MLSNEKNELKNLKQSQPWIIKNDVFRVACG